MKKAILSISLALVMVLAVFGLAACFEKEYTVNWTVPAAGVTSFSVKNGTATVEPNTKIKDGTELTVSWVAAANYTVTVKVGSTAITNGSDYKVTADTTFTITATQNPYVPVHSSVTEGFTVHTWTAGDPDVGVLTEDFSIENGDVIVSVAAGTKFIQLNIAEFLADNEIVSITRNDIIEDENFTANVYELVAMNSGHGTETWKLAGTDDEGQTIAEIQAALEAEEADPTDGALFVYPDTTWIYFGPRVDGVLKTNIDLEEGDSYEIVFTASNGDTYTLKIVIAIAA